MKHTSIPNLQANDGVGIAVDDAFGHEACANGGSDLGRVEGALAVAHHEACFADALTAQHDNLCLQCRGHFGQNREQNGKGWKSGYKAQFVLKNQVYRRGRGPSVLRWARECSGQCLLLSAWLDIAGGRSVIEDERERIIRWMKARPQQFRTSSY